MLSGYGYAYLSARPTSSSTAPLFFDGFGKKLSQAWFLSRLRPLLERIGLHGKDFGGISLRKGGARTLLKLHANDKIIMGMGRWKSACFNRYLNIDEDDIEGWQSKMASFT